MLLWTNDSSNEREQIIMLLILSYYAAYENRIEKYNMDSKRFEHSVAFIEQITQDLDINSKIKIIENGDDYIMTCNTHNHGWSLTMKLHRDEMISIMTEVGI